MKDLVCVELRKAFGSKMFAASIIIGSALSVATSFINYFTIYHASYMAAALYETKWFDPSILTCFRYWLVADFNRMTTYLFFMLVPLLAVLPYAWSYMMERSSGYAMQIASRAPRSGYLLAKGAATFASGAAAVAVPVVLGLIVIACLVPARVPYVTSEFYFGIDESSFWSELFYNEPILYSVCYIVLIAGFSGVWAVLVMLTGCAVRDVVALTVLPYLVLIGVRFACENVFYDIVQTALTPFDFLRPVSGVARSNPWVVAGFFALCIAISVGFALMERKRDLL